MDFSEKSYDMNANINLQNNIYVGLVVFWIIGR